MIKVLLILLPILLFPSLLTAQFRDIYFSEKSSGDDAAAHGDYALAARFYERFLKKAKGSSDPEREREAYERCIDALTRSGAADRADELYTEYVMRYPGSNPLSVSLLRAGILLGRKQYGGAWSLLERLLPGIPIEDPRRKNAVEMLGRAAEGNRLFVKAAEAYGMLRDESSDPAVKRTAHERALFTAASADNPEVFFREVARFPEYAEENPAIVRLAAVYALLNGKAPASRLQAAWAEVLKNEKAAGKERISFSLFSAIGDCACREKMFIIAAEAYRSACRLAPGKTALFATLRRLIGVYEALGNTKMAAGPALLTYRLFEEKYVSPELKFKVARILTRAGQPREAEEIYRNLLASGIPDEQIRIAAEECAFLCGSSDRFPEAEKLIRTYFTGEHASYGSFLRAEILLKRKEYRSAAEAFEKLSAVPEFRDRAIHQRILALLSSGENEKARQEGAALEKSAADPLFRLKGIYLQGKALEKAGKRAEAGALYSRYAADQRAEPALETESLFKAGVFALERRDIFVAEHNFQTVMTKYPRSEFAPVAAVWLIYSLRSRGEIIASENATWELVRQHPGSDSAIEALFFLAAHEIESGTVRRARNALNTVMKYSLGIKEKRRACKLLAEASFRNGEYPDAMAMLDQLFLKDPEAKNVPELLYLYGDILKTSGKYAKAVEYYRLALAAGGKEPFLAAAAHGSMGDCYFTLAEQGNQSEKHYVLAEKEFSAAASLPLIPEIIRVMNLYKLGRTCEMLGRDDNARRAYREAVLIPVEGSPREMLVYAAKSAEALAGIAARRPLRVHVEEAVSAVRRLEKLKILREDEAEERIRILRSGYPSRKKSRQRDDTVRNTTRNTAAEGKAVK